MEPFFLNSLSFHFEKEKKKWEEKKCDCCSEKCVWLINPITPRRRWMMMPFTCQGCVISPHLHYGSATFLFPPAGTSNWAGRSGVTAPCQSIISTCPRRVPFVRSFLLHSSPRCGQIENRMKYNSCLIRGNRLVRRRRCS
jgi:hypothetical protein